MRRNKSRKQFLTFALVLIMLSVGVIYAFLQANLSIEGTTKIQSNTWDIHFTNIQVATGSVSINTENDEQGATIVDDTEVSFAVSLNEIGSFYEFTVDVYNAGTIDGMIGSITSKINDTTITTLPAYLNYIVEYSDGFEIEKNQVLEAGSRETIRIKLEVKPDVNVEDLPSQNEDLYFDFTLGYSQRDANSIPVRVPPESFATDSWKTITWAVENNNTSQYHVGDTKTIDLGTTLGTHTVRIANMSTPSECETTGFSQTACGFVIEFADIITTHNMNLTANGTTTIGDGNVGGWPASSMRTYVNADIYNALPVELRKYIIDTTVVSGHGSTAGEVNFISTDRLYLLSPHEVWEDVDGNVNAGIDYRDTSYNNTRQLDYYAGLNVTTSSYSRAIKKDLSETATIWWLRSAYSGNTVVFSDVIGDGSWNYDTAITTRGVSPAFRIG
ncbi:MAG: hypothetical protein IJG68_06745 [Bacilli bacterium]|nr:hypothetical protein [Bacilli bacterium]